MIRYIIRLFTEKYCDLTLKKNMPTWLIITEMLNQNILGGNIYPSAPWVGV